MILHYDEFLKHDEFSAYMLSEFKSTDVYLHETDIEQIKKFLAKGGTRGSAVRKTVLSKYLRWLSNEYKISVQNLNFELRLISDDDLEFDEIFFYSLDELVQTTNQLLEKASLYYEAQGQIVDFDGYRVFCLLQWYGIDIKNFISINLSDVKKDSVFVPNINKVFVLDETVAEIINEYKNKDSVLISNGKGSFSKAYRQSTLYRSTKNSDISRKTILNIRAKFQQVCKDKRYSLNRICNSGTYYRLLQLEEQLQRDLTIADSQIINQMFYRDLSINVFPTLADFADYKKRRQTHQL